MTHHLVIVFYYVRLVYYMISITSAKITLTKFKSRSYYGKKQLNKVYIQIANNGINNKRQ